MPLSVKSYAAQSPTSPLGLFHFVRRDPRPDDVVIDIEFCGVCHTDLHTARNDWGHTAYPVVPGHEIIGRVTAVGSQVTRVQVGDRVGVGCLVDSCRGCAACGKGWEQYCEKGASGTYNSKDRVDGTPTQGGYSDQIVVTQDFVLKVPKALDPAGAAPLLCAGVTMWSPLQHWKATRGQKVAIVGLGGLGHMGLKLAKALGAEVALFSRSPGKEEDARRLGADQVVISTDRAQMKAMAGRFDLIIDTVPYEHDVNPYLPTLATGGTLVLVGYLGQLQQAPAKTTFLVLGRKSIAGSLIGGVAETQAMLDFCGAQGITADVERIPMQGIEAAYARMLTSDVKYRFVVDMASMKAEAAAA